MNFKVILLSFVAMFLIGCSTAKKETETKYVTQIETSTIVLDPPKHFYNASVVRIRPPEPNKYLNATWEQKEKMLMEMINKQNIQIEACMRDRYSISDWVRDNQELINKKQVKPTNTKAKK